MNQIQNNTGLLGYSQMSRIQRFTHNDKIIYSSDREVLSVYANENSEIFLNLELSKFIIDNIAKLWNQDTYNFFTEINDDVKELQSKESELQKFESQQKNTVLYNQIVPKEQEKIDQKTKAIDERISLFLKKNNHGMLKDLLLEGNLSKDYQYYFLNNIWFEVFIYTIFKNLDVAKEVIFRCRISGKTGFKHQIDIAMITSLYTVIIEAKSRGYKKQEYMDLIGKKSDINADIAVLISGEDYPHDAVYSDKYRNVFVFDRIFDKNFEEVVNLIKEIFLLKK